LLNSCLNLWKIQCFQRPTLVVEFICCLDLWKLQSSTTHKIRKYYFSLLYYRNCINGCDRMREKWTKKNKFARSTQKFKSLTENNKNKKWILASTCQIDTTTNLAQLQFTYISVSSSSSSSWNSMDWIQNNSSNINIRNNRKEPRSCLNWKGANEPTVSMTSSHKSRKQQKRRWCQST